MDYKKTNAPSNTVTRNMADFVNETGNVYESVAIIGKRSNQIAAEMKEELLKKLNEFSSSTPMGLPPSPSLVGTRCCTQKNRPQNLKVPRST